MSKESLAQKLLGSGRTPFRGDTPADRKLRAKQRMVDMTPAQKKKELARLRAKKARSTKK